jgi:hypothetical protein
MNGFGDVTVYTVNESSLTATAKQGNKNHFEVVFCETLTSKRATQTTLRGPDAERKDLEWRMTYNKNINI